MYLRTLVTLLLASCLSFGAVASATPAQDKKQEAEAVNIPHERVLKRVWWNRLRPVKLLGLSSEQRAKMDQILVGFLHKNADSDRERKASLPAVNDAIAAGDMEKARTLINALLSARLSLAEQQTDMMINVTTILTTEQRKTLIREYPKLFSNSWIHSANNTRMKAKKKMRQKVTVKKNDTTQQVNQPATPASSDKKPN